MKNGAKFDREKYKNGYIDLVIGTLEFKPSVLPIGEQQTNSTVKVRIHVKDDNDNSPVFLPSKYNFPWNHFHEIFREIVFFNVFFFFL